MSDPATFWTFFVLFSFLLAIGAILPAAVVLWGGWRESRQQRLPLRESSNESEHHETRL